MALFPITPPTFCFPKKDFNNPCPCQDIPVELTHKSGLIFWLKESGDLVSKGDPIASLEVEKKTVELLSPHNGILADIIIDDGETFEFNSILGHIEVS